MAKARKRARTSVASVATAAAAPSQSCEERLVQTTLTQTDFGFRSRKRRGQFAAQPKEGENESASKENQPVVRARVDGDKGPPANFRATAVQVDAVVKRVYRLIDQKSYLVWGLTSDWAVEAGSARKTRSAHRRDRNSPPAAEEEAEPPAPNNDNTDPAATRDGASEGYGEMTAGSIQRLLNYLRKLHQHVHENVSQPKSHWNLTPASSFIDVGSGYGKVVLHAGLAVELACAHGVEYVPSRSTIAEQVLSELKAMQQSGTLKQVPQTSLDAVTFTCGDATVEPYADLQYSHVYIYDKVFSDTTIERLATNLNQSNVRVLITYQRPETWFRLGLSHKFVKLASMSMNTTGQQNFSCHILLKDL